MELIFFPYSKILTQRAEPVESFDNSLRDLIEEMNQIMEKNDGIGLAAPQVGISKRIFITRGEDNQTNVFINPKITKRYGKVSTLQEGCLSVPGFYFPVERPNIVDIEFYDARGNFMSDFYTGVEARKIQHENDHLDGWLIPFYSLPFYAEDFFTFRNPRITETLSFSDIMSL